MNVVRAENAGACYGVQRALDIALSAVLEGDPVYTLGPLIHNPVVVAELQGRGVRVTEDLACEDGATVVIRSHGVTPEVRDEVASRGFAIVDATCPHVARAQKAATALAEEGCRVIVVGEAGHPEVEGLMAYARLGGAKVDVVSVPDDVPQDLRDPIGVVVQTTQRRENLEAVVERIRAQGVEPRVKDTICLATRQRQDAARRLAKQVDAMVVVGGRNSSNTTRLAEICRACCPLVVHVESPEELDLSMFEGLESVGVTAGASTPESHIDAVVELLES